MFGEIFIIPFVLRTRARYYKHFAKHACDFSLILLKPCNFLYKFLTMLSLFICWKDCKRSLAVEAVAEVHRHRNGAGLIPARGPIVNEFISTLPGFNFNMCMICTIDNQRNELETQVKSLMLLMLRPRYGLIRFTLKPCISTLNIFQDFVFTNFKQERQCLCDY